MAVTTIDLRLSRGLAPRTFEEARMAELTLPDADEAATATNALAGQLQKWRVARVHLVEQLGLPFRCEVFITRIETLRADPSVANPAPNTIFDDAGNAIDQLKTIDDNMGNLQPWDNPTDIASNVGAILGAVGPAATTVTNAVSNAATNLANQNLEQYVLGIPPPTVWVPEVPPRPGVFLGQLCSVLITRNGQGNVPLAGRWITGLVTEYEDLGVGATARRLVRLVIEPQLARLSLRTNHRVFERQDVMQIVRAIFAEAGIYAGGPEVLSTFKPRPYCIQYGETDLDFVQRLFSEEGLCPVFECHLGAERLKLALPNELVATATFGYGSEKAVETLDAVDMPRLIPNELVHAPVADAATEEILWDFAVTRTIASTAARLRSANFSSSYVDGQLPTHVRQDQDESATGADIDLAFATVQQGDLHVFPARTSFAFDPEPATQTDEVELLSEARRELIAARAASRVGRGRTNAVGLSAGQHVSVTHGLLLTNAAFFDAEVQPFGDFVITRLETLAENEVTPTQATLPNPPFVFQMPPRVTSLESVFAAVPSELPFLPARRRAPRVDGVHTAITRASVSEWQDGHGRIGVDPIGRVRATLPWDRRLPEGNEQPLSPPIRVATPWAGHAWGTTFLPREGMELLLAYVDGDPTQPVALGALHGFVNPAPRERPHIDFVTGKNRIDPKEEKVLGDDERRLHYDAEKQKRPTGDRHLNALRTAIHPAPKDDAFKAFHELSFDDTPGRERVRLHSAGLFEEKVVHDHRTWVGRDQVNIVQGRQNEQIGKDATLVVEGERHKAVTGHEDREVGGRQDVVVKGTKSLIVHKNLERWVGNGTPSVDRHRIGLQKGAGIMRLLTSRRDRKTLIQGDDERKVGGDVDVRCGGTYEIGGAPLVMKATAANPAGGAGLTTDGEAGETTLDGAEGTCELVADGPVTIKAKEIDLRGTTAVRLECGEVSVEINENEIIMTAPGGVSLFVNGQPTQGASGEVPASATSLEMEAPGGAIVLKLTDNLATEGGRLKATFRPGKVGGDMLDAEGSLGEDHLDKEDALQGGPGVKVAPVDSFQIKGGKSAFKSRRVEHQKKGGPKEVHRDMTSGEESLLKRIAEHRENIGNKKKAADAAVAKRDKAREEYLEAARKRKEIEARIKEDEGIDEDLAGAIDEVTEAERKLQEAKKAQRRAEDELKLAEKSGQSTDEKQDALDDAKSDVSSAEGDLADAEENLEEVREEHGGLMDEYVAAREKEEEKAAALAAAQDEVVRTENDLRAEEKKLRDAEREASELELDTEEKAAAD